MRTILLSLVFCAIFFVTSDISTACSDIHISNCLGHEECDDFTVFWQKHSDSECDCLPGDTYEACGEDSIGLCFTIWDNDDGTCENLEWVGDGGRFICITVGPLGMFP
jgi:hypothetical protein